VGVEKGNVILYDANVGTEIKTISGIHESAILNVKFWKDGSNDHVISTDSSCNVYLITLNKIFWSVSFDK
jgi:hypothetical protein